MDFFIDLLIFKLNPMMSFPSKARTNGTLMVLDQVYRGPRQDFPSNFHNLFNGVMTNVWSCIVMQKKNIHHSSLGKLAEDVI